MSILSGLPLFAEILNKFIPDKAKQAELELELEKRHSDLELELKKLQLQENTARLGVLGGMLKHDSTFVSGCIPALVWILVIYIISNYMLFPILHGLGMDIAPVVLPDEYWRLLEITVVGLFGIKGIIDDNEWRWKGELICPSKAQTDVAASKGIVKPVGDEDYKRKYEEAVKKYKIK